MSSVLFCSPLQSHLSNSQEISAEEQYRRLNFPYHADLEVVFPSILVNIIAEYANSNLGQNGSNWMTALSNLNRLPSSIPTLPSNIHEILTGNSQIHQNQRVNESHSLWLIPAVTLDALAESFFGVRNNPLRNSLMESNGHFLLDEFPKHEWILITNELVQGTELKTYNQQIAMFASIQGKTFLPYEVPSMKYAVAAKILHLTVEKNRGLTIKNDAKGITRTLETFGYLEQIGNHVRVHEGGISVSSSRGESNESVTLILKEVGCELISTEIGMAALIRFNPPTPPLCEGSCNYFKSAWDNFRRFDARN